MSTALSIRAAARSAVTRATRPSTHRHIRGASSGIRVRDISPTTLEIAHQLQLAIRGGTTVRSTCGSCNRRLTLGLRTLCGELPRLGRRHGDGGLGRVGKQARLRITAGALGCGRCGGACTSAGVAASTRVRRPVVVVVGHEVIRLVAHGDVAVGVRHGEGPSTAGSRLVEHTP